MALAVEHDPIDRYGPTGDPVFLTGTQALVRLLVEQVRRDRALGHEAGALVSGYPGSPLGVLDLELARNAPLLADHRIVHRPAVNEELGATAVMGTQLLASTSRHPTVGTLVGMWYGKAPGLDRASDALRHANHVGCPPTGGVLAVVGDDPGAKSSTLPTASESALAGLGMAVLFPADPGEVVELGLHGFALSRLSGLWVGLKVVTSVADGSQSVTLAHRQPPVAVSTTFDGQRYVHTPTLKLAGKATLDLERSLYTTRLEIARRYITANGLNQVVVRGPADRIGILAAGKTWLDLRQALATIGLTDDLLRHHGIRLIKLGALYPLDADELRRFTSGLDQLVVVEEKRPFVESQLRDLLYRDAVRPDILGKTDAGGGELFPAAAELDADAIAAAIVGPLQAGGPIPAIGQWRDRRTAGPGRSIPLAVRTPYFCSGCPHNRSTKVPDDALVGGGIGCHGMAVLMSPTQVGRIMGLTQMGGEGAQWIGMAPFAGERHIFQNLGDGTYFHSGSLAVRAAVAAGVNVTYKIMYNSAIAMTGGQDPAGGRPIGDLVRILLAEGARRVIVTSDDPKRTARTGIPRGTDVWHRDRLEEAQIELAKMAGVTVLVHDQECAAERRRKRKRHKAPDPPTRYAINPRICEGCGDCGVKSNCLSLQPVETEYGTKTRINQASCNKDYSCVDGDCPSFVAVRPVRRRRTPAGGTGPTGAGQSPTRPAGTLPAPPLAPRDHCSLRLLGIGGTGVMTAAQIVAVAAMVDGLQLRGLDQTGLAQKGGPVVSDLVITGTEAEVGNKLGEASCDLYLVFDMVVGANPDNLRVATPATTAVVASTDLTPTADMIGHLDKTLAPTEEFVERIAERTDPGRSAYMDAHTICEQRFGGAEYVNVFLLGVASQRGLLPMRPEAVEQAIERNGASVGTNLAAFDLGRRWVLDATLRDDPPPRGAPAHRSDVPGTAQRALDERCVAAGLPTTGTLAELVRRRAADLVGYQSVSYACRYIDFVGSVYRRESERRHDGDGELTRTVAVYLHKLLAYKDEYEVARLATGDEVADLLLAQFGPGVRTGVMLHPPALRALGLHRKLRLERSAGPLFTLLRGMRRLRGTPFDPFGRTEVRRTERRLIDEYQAAVVRVLDDLDAGNYRRAVEIAALPDLVRGFEEIKLRSVGEFRRRLGELSSGSGDAGGSRVSEPVG